MSYLYAHSPAQGLADGAFSAHGQHTKKNAFNGPARESALYSCSWKLGKAWKKYNSSDLPFCVEVHSLPLSTQFWPWRGCTYRNYMNGCLAFGLLLGFSPVESTSRRSENKAESERKGYLLLGIPLC